MSVNINRDKIFRSYVINCKPRYEISSNANIYMYDIYIYIYIIYAESFGLIFRGL